MPLTKPITELYMTSGDNASNKLLPDWLSSIPSTKRDANTYNRWFLGTDGTPQFAVLNQYLSSNFIGIQGAYQTGSPVLVAMSTANVANVDITYAAKGSGGHYLGNEVGVNVLITDDKSGFVNNKYLTIQSSSGNNNPKISSSSNAQFDVPSGYSHLFSVNGVVQGAVAYSHSVTTGLVYPYMSSGNGACYIIATGALAQTAISSATMYLQSIGNIGGFGLLNGQGSLVTVTPNGGTKNGLIIRPSSGNNSPVLMYAAPSAYDGTGDPNVSLKFIANANGSGRVQASTFDLTDTRFDSGLLRIGPTTGFAQTISSNGSGSGGLLLTPVGTLASGTITLPLVPSNGQIVRVITTQTVTSLTITTDVSQTVVGAPSTIQANTPFSFIFDSASSTWVRYT